MSSYRCTLCGINYPHSSKYVNCPIHHTPTNLYAIEQHVDWAERAARIADRIQLGNVDERDDIRVLHVDIHRKGAWLFIFSQDVIRLGVNHQLPVFEVIEIPGKEVISAEGPTNQLYEIFAYVEAHRQYWIGQLRVPDTVPD